MARIRTIKPEFWQDEDLAMLDSDIRLLALGLLNHADDEGYFKAHHALIRAAVFPFTDGSLNIQGMLNELSNIGYLRLFEGSDGKHYGVIKNFAKHQKVNRPSPSKIKGLEGITDNSVSPHEQLTGGKEQGTGKGNNINPKKKSLDYSSWPDMPSEQKFDDWKQLRKTKKAPISQTVINKFGKELAKAEELGFTVEECFEQILCRSWQGFEADWLKGSNVVPLSAPVAEYVPVPMPMPLDN